MLGKNAVQTGKGTFAAQDTSSYREYISYYNKSERRSEGFVFEIKAVNNQPTMIIPNAWGIESVMLDGKEINYAKDWRGAVERMDNSTAHTLTFKRATISRWKPTTSPHGRRLTTPPIAVPAPGARRPEKPQTTPKPPTTTGSGWQ